MILKKCINGSMILIDGISEVHVYEKDGFPWVQIQRGKEQSTHRLDEPAYILNDDGKTIERLPYCSAISGKITGGTISSRTDDGKLIRELKPNTSELASDSSISITLDGKEITKNVIKYMNGEAKKYGKATFIQ